MPFSVITLAAAGADTGPFDLYSDDDSYAVAFETGVSKSSLLAGYYTFVPVGATTVRVKSASALCTNFVDMGITTTSTTSTTSTTTTETPLFTTLNYGVSLSDPNQACDNYELGVLTPMYVLDSEIPIGLGDHLYSIANVANPAPAGFYARPCVGLGICTFQVTGAYGEITSVDGCGTLTTTTTTTLPPEPTYVSIPALDYAYNTSNAANVGVCCVGSALYMDSLGNFVTTPTAGYTLVAQFWVDDNGGTYFDTATVMYASNGTTLFPVPAGYYGSGPIGYRRIVGTAGQFSTSLTSCAGVDCP